MNRFDREQLVTALQEAGNSADDDMIWHLEHWLYMLRFKYQVAAKGYVIGHAKPSRELKNLNRALLEWTESDNWEWEANSIHRLDDLKLSAMEWFSRSVSEFVTRLESAKRNTRGEDLRTSFFIELYKKYVELSGNKGLSDDGPAIRFITQCASILNVTVPQAVRRRIQLAIIARKKRGFAEDPRLVCYQEK
jgi:hypothetical protein